MGLLTTLIVLMFVFWYCHKRGKEVRLAAQDQEKGGDGVVEDGDGELEIEVTDEEEVDGDEEGLKEEKDETAEEAGTSKESKSDEENANDGVTDNTPEVDKTQEKETN
jgi:hypothetical protein